MDRTYAVTWRDGSGPVCVGKLELGTAVELVGRTDAGDLANARVTRDRGFAVRPAENGDRLRGRRTLVLVRADGSEVAVASLDGPGTILELAERLAA